MRSPVAVHVWRDEPPNGGRGVWYTVSTVDADGDEISYSGGSESLSRAWASGLDLAARLGVPAIQMAGRSSQITARSS